MKTLHTSQGVRLAVVLVMLVIAGCAALLYFPTRPVLKNHADPSLVRGYLAAAVGRSPEAERGGLYSRELDPQDIHLPGVTVYLQDVATSATSGDVRTDLSGRFTLQAPKQSQYQLCWKSAVYGGECLPTAFLAGHEPVFLSTLRVRIAPRQDHVASYGKVRFADDSPPRTLEPFGDVNAFATVRLFDARKKLLAEVPVNNHGDYLLPYLPAKEPVTLVAKIEKTESAQDILPDTYVKNPRVVRFHLTLQNTPPRLDAITPVDGATGRRVQVGTPGQTLRLRAETRDRDGDPVQVQWLLDPGSGSVSSATGAQVDWKLPSQPGRHSVTAVAGDGRGGYARYTVRLSAGAPGVPFGGVVAATDGTLLANADVEVNGKLEKTDAQGRFLSFVPEAERYVLSIRKPGYGFYSRVYDRSVAGGRWTLVRATVAEFDPTLAIVFQDKRTPRNCPGADSTRIKWDEDPIRKRVYWQDGKGNNIAPPFHIESGKGPILPWQRRTSQQPECGPGLAVRIPANALQTAGGAAPTGKVELSLATVDLGTPEQMPGDDTVRTGATTPSWMASYGAGSVALRDTGSGQALKLRPGATAEVAIPVDPMQLAAGAPLPPTMPLLYYDEAQGRWQQDGVLTLDAAQKNYVAKVTHFSSLNADVLFTNPSCVRVQSTIPTPYDLELTIPMPGGAAPKIKQITITDAPPHVIYALPNNQPITIVAIAPGGVGVPPRTLGVFIVDSGPPQAAGFGLPPPASACATEVVLSTQTFPDVPPAGEFLHGLFAFSATTINEADIGTAGSVSQLLDQATTNYYAQVDPTNERTTFAGFRTKNGFTKPPGFQLCAGVPCTDPDVEINAVYANSGDLGFGRDMHCRRTASGTGFDYACYVTNYGDITTDDALDAQNARTNAAGALVATVAMEFSRVAATDPVDERHVKFYVYNAAGNRVKRADLDGKGLRPVPQLCMVCHGGAYPGGGTTLVPAFTSAASVKLGSRFLPFDNRFFTFPASPDKAGQQAAIKRLNEDIVRNAPSLAPAPDAIADVIAGMYAGGSATQLEEFVVDPWKQAQLPNTLAQEQFYRRVVGNACRTCHMAQPFANASSERAGVDLQFRSARDFLRSQSITGGGDFSPFTSAEQRVCAEHLMPHAKRTHDIFWGQYWSPSFGAISPTLPAQFQTFGDTIKALPRPAGWPAGEAWPPVWNGRLCGPFTTAGVTPPSFYSTHVHILWSRDWNASGTRCTTCHADLSGNATDTRAKLLSGFFGGAVPEVIAGNVAGSILHQRVTGSAGAKMPQSCPGGSPARRCLNDAPGAYNPAADAPADISAEIDRIEFWITNGAAP